MISNSTHKRISRKVHDLIEINQPTLADRQLIRMIMDGGKEAVASLLGPKVAEKQLELPIANLILSASNRLAYKLGKVPTLKVESPDHINNERAMKAADKRARIVRGWDEQNELEMLYPQIGRWLPGYGFATAVIKQSLADNGDPYPRMELRDPYETYLGEWGTDQQPRDVAYVRVARPERLAQAFPKLKTFFENIASGTPSAMSGSLAVPSQSLTPGLSRGVGNASWENQSGQGVSIYEYYDEEGVWWVLPEHNRVLLHIPNPLDSGPLFVAVKRFSFNKLIGQYNHAIGLLTAIARINLNLMIGIEDSVHAETNIHGEFNGTYKRGRGQVNKFPPGTQVDRPRSTVPFEAFQQANRLDEQLRVIANYPVQEDSVSPNSFVTGRGLEELRTSVSQEVAEYFTSLSRFQRRADGRRLEYCHKLYPNRKLTVEGEVHGAPYVETFTPDTHINGRYRTRRIYGMMTGWDEPTKIITGLQLLQAELLDPETIIENLDGVEDPSKIMDKVKANRAEGLLMSHIAQMSQMGDPRATEIILEMMQDGELKNKVKDILIPTEEEIAQMEQQQQQQQGGIAELMAGAGGGGAGLGGDSTQTILERLTTSGEPFAGVQTVRS